MGLNFRKSFKIFPGTRLNVSKNGLGASFGVPGARVSFGKKGVQKTLGIPGTGLSHTSKVFKRAKKSKDETTVGDAVEFLVADQVEAMQNPRSPWPGYLLVGVCFLIGFAVVVRLLN